MVATFLIVGEFLHIDICSFIAAPRQAPQDVKVTKSDINGTVILISWKAPPVPEEAGVIQEYKV